MSNSKIGGYKLYIILVSILVLLIVTISAISAIWPRSEEKFFELGLLGKNMKAENFFPSNPSIQDLRDPYLSSQNVFSLDEPMNWNIFLENHMGSEQLVTLEVKFLGSDPHDRIPDDTLHEPSNVRSSFNITLALKPDQSTLIPFNWSVTRVDYGYVYDKIRSLTINGKPVELYCYSNDTRFRIVFELWVWDSSRKEFVYGWNSGNEYLSASVYIWFKTRYI